jgi:TraK protein
MWPTSNSRGKALLVLLALGLIPHGSQAAPKRTSVGGPPIVQPTAHADSEPPLPNEIVVSDRDFNQFVFAEAITNGPIFPAGAPVLGKPVYLAGNTQLLLQVKPGADKPFNMIVELGSGAVYKFWLRPRPIPGITHHVAAASEPGYSSRHVSAATSQAGSPRGADVELLKHVVIGQVPEGFEAIELPPPTRFDKFTVVPLSAWSDGASRRVLMFSLVAVSGQTAIVAPPQFYRLGITAALIDGDVVDAAHSPTLYIVEEVSDE